MVGLFGAPAAPPVARGDELSDAKAAGAAQEGGRRPEGPGREAERPPVGARRGDHETKTQLKGINADLTAVRKKITKMEGQIKEVQTAYDALVDAAPGPGRRARRVTAQEAPSGAELTARTRPLADRVRNAYDTDRTSLLETFLSGGTFTDMLAEMSYYIDVGEQDKALASQIATDQETLAALHQTVADTRTETDDLRRETAAQKRDARQEPDRLKAAQGRAQELEKRTPGRSASRRRATPARPQQGRRRGDHRQGRRRPEEAGQADQRAHRQQVQKRQHPVAVQRHDALADGQLQSAANYGCSSFAYYAAGQRLRPLSQRHRPGRPVRPQVKAAGGGHRRLRRLELGGRPRPGLDRDHRPLGRPATWYAHMQPHPSGDRRRVVSRRARSSATRAPPGHATGAHLHWMVEHDGDFVNPRLFL